MEGRERHPRGGEEDVALREPSRGRGALAGGALAPESSSSWAIPAPFSPARRGLDQPPGS